MLGKLGVAGVALACALAGTPAAHAFLDASCAGPAPGGDWRQFGDQLTGDRVQEHEAYLYRGRAATLAPTWTFDANRASGVANNEVTGYPIEADGCVFVGTSTGFKQQGWVFAIDADTGEGVWRVQVDRGGVYSTLAVTKANECGAHGCVIAFVSDVKVSGSAPDEGPYVIALDEWTGATVWRTTVDHQIGSDAVSSPVVWDGLVWVGVSGTAAEISQSDRSTLQGSTVLLDARTGSLLKQTYTIPPKAWASGYAGGSQWGTIAIDPETGYGYEGTGNPFNFDSEYPTTNAVLKIDLARARDGNGAPMLGSGTIQNPTFGAIVDSYKGTVEEYFPDVAHTAPCAEVDALDQPVNLLGVECGRLDLDFGAQPNIFRLANGRKVVGIGQKSGIYHVVDADTMDRVWEKAFGVPSPVGGIVGSAAYDGTNVYGPHTIGGYLWSLGKEHGDLNWVSPVGDGVHWGPPVTLANGILYTVDLTGFLDAYDAATGAPVLHRPMMLGADTIGEGPFELPNGRSTQAPHANPTFSWAGTTVARNTVYASVGIGLSSAEQDAARMPDGYVIAFRPPLDLPL